MPRALVESTMKPLLFDDRQVGLVFKNIKALEEEARNLQEQWLRRSIQLQSVPVWPDKMTTIYEKLFGHERSCVFSEEEFQVLSSHFYVLQNYLNALRAIG